MDTESRRPNGFLVFVSSLVALLVVALLLIWSIASGPKPQDLEKMRAQQRIATRERLDKESTDLLSTAAIVDPAKGTVRLPVAELFSSIAMELKAKKAVASAVKVEATLPNPAADPASNELPPPALPSSPQGADTIRFEAPQTPPAAGLGMPAPSAAAMEAGAKPVSPTSVSQK